MWTMGSPFDAPLPRFQQAAAHLSSNIGPNAKKPPLSPSLPIDGEKSLQGGGGSMKPMAQDLFASSPSLEHSASLSNISRRRISGSLRNDFGSTHSLPFVQECAAETNPCTSSDAAMQMPSTSSCEPLQAQTSLPPVSSLLIPQPSSCRWLPRNFSSLVAATGMLALLVMSVVILWPPSGGAGTSSQPLQQPPSINIPRKFFDRIFNGNQPQHMEHFTAAQGAGWGTGFGLEDSSQPIGMEVIPSDDFTNFVSSHLGWEDEDTLPEDVAEARFEHAEAMNDHLPRAGGFGEGLVNIDAKGVDHVAHAISAAVTASAKTGAAASQDAVKIEGRKELETGTTAAAATTAAKPANAASSGVIPQETLKSGNPLANSIGVADPLNLVDTDSTTPVSNSGGSSKARIAVQPGIAGGVNQGTQMSSTTTQMAGSFATTTTTSKPVIAVQPTTGGGTNSNSQMAAGTNTGTTVTAAGLRTSSATGKASGSGATSRGAGTGSVGSNQPLESVAAGQVASVAQTDLSSSASTSTSAATNPAATTFSGSFKPLAG